MAGHSKWANIRRRKASQDREKNKLRTRIIREIMVASQQGEAENNPRLQFALQTAKKANVPKNKIEEAIKKATNSDDKNYEELLYEGYAPHGVALVIETTTDNPRRTVGIIRSILTKYGGKMSKGSSINHLFARKGIFVIPVNAIKEKEDFTLLLLEAAIDSFEEEEDFFYITCPLTAFNNLRKCLAEEGVIPEQVELRYIPHTTIPLSEGQMASVEKLIERLEEEDDIQHVYDNMSPKEIK